MKTSILRQDAEQTFGTKKDRTFFGKKGRNLVEKGRKRSTNEGKGL